MRQSPTNPRGAVRSATTAARSLPVWQLQDAKAHFGQVVREARTHGPQRVTVHGKEAVDDPVGRGLRASRSSSGATKPPCSSCLARRCAIWTSSTKASALRCATSSCEGLAVGYQRDLGVAQGPLRRSGQGLVGGSSSGEHVSEQDHDRRNPVRDRAITCRRSITKAAGGVVGARAPALVLGSAPRC